MMSKQKTSAFGTQIMDAKVSDFESMPIVKQLDIDPRAWLDLLAKVRKETPTSSLGVGGAYSSPKDVLKFDDACLAKATETILASLPDAPNGYTWEACAWMNVLKSGNAVGTHDHVKTDSGDNAWAAILYVQVVPGGSIVFHPEGAEDVTIEPKVGMLLVFPAALAHSVPEYKGDKARVSVAWNVKAVKV